MPIPKAHLNLALQSHLEYGLRERGIKLRQTLPNIGFEGTKEIYLVVDAMLKEVWSLASSFAHKEDAVAKMILEKYPDLDDSVARRMIKHAFNDARH